MRLTHSHGHLGYSKHGQGNRAVAQMDDKKIRVKREGYKEEPFPIGYTAPKKHYATH